VAYDSEEIMEKIEGMSSEQTKKTLFRHGARAKIDKVHVDVSKTA
jgi:hypothetical protein